MSVIAAQGAPAKRLSADQRDLAERHLALARALARRFSDRGEPVADLEQVAFLALVKAARRYDPEFGVAFVSYATPSILGELKRHFRDHSWAMRVPRHTQETYLALKRANEDLEQRLCRAPTVKEVSAYIGASEEDVLEAMDAGRDFWPAPLPTASGAEDETDAQLLTEEGGFELTVRREALRQILPRLDSREQQVLHQYYFEGRTQRSIGADVGLSQMQVSRVINQALERLRSLVADAS